MTEFLIGGYGPDMGGEAVGVGRARTAPDGRLEYLGMVVQAPSPTWITVAADGAVFATLEGTAELAALGRVDALSLTDRVPAGGGLPCHLAVDGERLITACYEDGTVSVHRRVPGDRIDGPTEQLLGEGSGPWPAQAGSHAHHVLRLVDGRILTVDLGADLIHLHRWEGSGTARQLVRYDSLPMPAGHAPRDPLLLSDGRIAILGEWGGELVVVEPSGATFEIVQIESVPGVDENTQAAGLVSSSDGRFLFAGLRGADRVAIFGVDADEIRGIGSFPCGGRWPRHLAVDGDTLHVANQRSSTVASFRITGAGELVSLGDPVPVPSPTVIVPLPRAETLG